MYLRILYTVILKTVEKTITETKVTEIWWQIFRKWMAWQSTLSLNFWTIKLMFKFTFIQSKLLQLTTCLFNDGAVWKTILLTDMDIHNVLLYNFVNNNFSYLYSSGFLKLLRIILFCSFYCNIILELIKLCNILGIVSRKGGQKYC